DHVGTDRDGGTGTRPQGRGAGGVVRVGWISGPGAALIPEGRGQHLVRMVAPARVTRSPVVFSVDRLGEDDCALGAELLHQDVVAGREIDVVAGVATAG